jgi:DNA gyrase subunit A
MAVKSGRAIRFPEEKVRVTGRGAIGVQGIEVDDANDEVIGMICVNKDDASRSVLVVSERGFGKKTPVSEYRITNRGGKGVKTINVTDKTGTLVGILDVTLEEDLIITCKSGITLRTAIADIKEAGRNTQGVTIIKVHNNDAIAALSKIEKEEEIVEEIEAAENQPDGAVSNNSASIDINPEIPPTEDNSNDTGNEPNN